MPGPGMFPILCASGIMFCGALLLFETWNAMRKEKKAGVEDPDLEANIVNIGELKNLALFMGLGIFVLYGSDYLGLLSCLCLSIIAYIKIQGKDPLWKAAAIAVGATIFLYAVFVLFLKVPLPKGPFGF